MVASNATPPLRIEQLCEIGGVVDPRYQSQNRLATNSLFCTSVPLVMEKAPYSRLTHGWVRNPCVWSTLDYLRFVWILC
jgi:hypothetical protein